MVARKKKEGAAHEAAARADGACAAIKTAGLQRGCLEQSGEAICSGRCLRDLGSGVARSADLQGRLNRGGHGG